MRFPCFVCACLALTVLAAAAEANEWAFRPSYYTHRPDTGERVTQYTPIGPFYRQTRSDYVTSGYRQTRIRIRVGSDVDNTHLVEEWGRRVRPYGEWQRPYRPYSVPYDLWGPPYGGLNYNYYGRGPGGPGFGGPPFPGGGAPAPHGAHHGHF